MVIPEDHAPAEKSRYIQAAKYGDPKKKDSKAIILTVIAAAACVMVFLLIIGPKFLGVQYLPFGPFGIVAEDEASGAFDDEDDEDFYPPRVSEDETSEDNEINREPDRYNEPAPVPAPESHVRDRSQYVGQFVIPDSHIRFLEYSDIVGLSEWDLFVARNEIFAWHGRGFNSEELHNYFTGRDWYTELYTSTEYDHMPSPLNKYEEENAKFILSYEREIDSYWLRN